MEECASTQSTRKTRSEKKKETAKQRGRAPTPSQHKSPAGKEAKPGLREYIADQALTETTTKKQRKEQKQNKKSNVEATCETDNASTHRCGQDLEKKKTADVSYVERLAACSAHVVRSAGNDTGPDTSPAPPACVAALQQAQASISPSLPSRDAARRTCTSARGRAAYLDKTCDPARNVQGRGRSLL